jgi:hypothetical protein
MDEVLSFNDTSLPDQLSSTSKAYLFFKYQSGYSARCDISKNYLIDMIDSSISYDIWTPAIITPEDITRIKSPILNKRNIRDPILGISDFIQFEPRFQNWWITKPNDTNRFQNHEITNSDPRPAGKMTASWDISSSFPTKLAEYGILFWYKKTSNGADFVSSENKRSISKEFLLSELPVNSVVRSKKPLTYSDGSQSITANTILIKITDTILKRIDRDASLITSSEILFNSESEIFDLSKANTTNDPANNPPKFYLYKNNVIKNNFLFDIWVSDGECFSYYDNIIDKRRSKLKQQQSKTYLSPALFNIYREIYNTLTLRRTKSNSGLNKTKSLNFQKLCYFLSSSPLIDRTTIDLLDTEEIYNRVQEYININPIPQNRATEITKLKEILNFILSKYAKFNFYFSKQNISGNYIQSYTALTQKILNKYPVQLSIGDLSETDSSKIYNNGLVLTYKKPLSNGPHALIGVNSTSLYNNSIEAEDIALGKQPNTIFYNNHKIEIGNFTYETDISSTGSISRFKTYDPTNDTPTILATSDLPFADISLIRDEPPPFYLGSGIYKEFLSTDREISIPGTDINQDSNPDFSYSWEQTGGSQCLRFQDFSRNPNRQKRYPDSLDSSPVVYIRSSGTYELKCTRSLNGLIQSDTIKITNDPNEQLDPDIDLQNNPITVLKNNKNIFSNIKQIAFNKRGLVWFLDSENYIDTQNIYYQQEGYGLGIFKIKDIKFDFLSNNRSTDIPVQDSDADLKLYFIPGKYTEILLNYIDLQNMRDSDYDFGQCQSFFRHKISHESEKPFEMILGDSDFTRSYRDSYDFYYHTLTGYDRNRKITYQEPEISTAFAPSIKAYGGYKKAVIDNIGIKMSGHPEPCDNSEPIMPTLFTRNSVNKPSVESSSGIYCHLREVLPTGNGTTINFSRGLFVPQSGWIPYSSSYYPRNNGVKISGTTYIGDDYHILSAYHSTSLTFKGPGLVDIRPSLTSSSNIYQSRIYVTSDTTIPISVDRRYGYKNLLTFDEPNFITEDIRNQWSVNGEVDEFTGTESCVLPTKKYIFPNNITDNTTIRDIEIKINFLNYPNPKNLIIWLDVKNPSISRNQESSYRDSINNPDLTKFISDIENLNTTTSPDTLRLYLLNQENIANYKYNFSFKFSDFANKFISPDNNTSNSLGYLSPNNETLKDKELCLPSLACSGYNDIEISKYKNAIKINQLNQIKNSFNKFYNVPLKNTQFILNIAVVDSISHEVSVLDNLYINDLVSGLQKTEKVEKSNTLSNSICSWEVIIHADNRRSTIQNKSDVLGKIDYNLVNEPFNLPILQDSIIPYSNSIGFQFIGDFTNKNYLIPQTNINAPYRYFANTSSCIYDDDELTKNITYVPPTFPSLIPYLLMPIVFGGLMTGAGLAGSMVTMELMASLYGTGGRNDPIINYFIETKLSNQTQALNSQVYKPVYRKQNFGSPERAIICASNDGAIWWKFETPIFRYTNTPILKKNVYKYIRLDSDIAEKISPSLKNNSISNFSFSLLASPTGTDLEVAKGMTSASGLQLAQSITSTTGNISLQGIQTINGIDLKKDNLISVEKQTDKKENGYYFVKENAWIKGPNQNSLEFLQYNNVDRDFTSECFKDNKSIVINGIRPYRFFDVNETIGFNIDGTKSTKKILGKSYFLTKNGIKTILQVDSELKDKDEKPIPSGFVYLDGPSSVIWLYKDDRTTVSDNDINKWTFYKSSSEKIVNKDPESHFSAYGEGSIGAGTNLTTADTLYKIRLKDNKLLDTQEMINNQISDRYLNYRFVLGDISQDIDSETFSDNSDANVGVGFSFRGWSYSSDDYVYKFDNENYNLITNEADDSVNVQKLKSALGIGSMIKNRKDNTYIELKYSEFKTNFVGLSGQIKIFDDFLNTTSIKFNQEDINRIRSRLSFIQEVDADHVSIKITGIDQVEYAMGINSLISYYNELQADDNNCFIPGYPITTGCPKQYTKQRLSSLYAERDELSRVLTIQNEISDLIPHISGSIFIYGIPDSIKPKISRNPDVLGDIKVSYKENKDLYWINIDPEQKCSIADELTVRVLNKVTSQATPIVDKFVYKSHITPQPPAAESIINSVGADEYYQHDGGKDIYFNPKKEQEKTAIKTKFPNLVWDNDEIFRYGSIQGDNKDDCKKLMIAFDQLPNDTLFDVEEEYIRPYGISTTGVKKIREVLDLHSNNLKIQFRNLPRKIKGIDTEFFDRYTYDNKGNLILASPNVEKSVGYIANNFTCWHCIDKQGRFVIPPDFYKAQNEMIYRAFFGSTDGIENKDKYTDSQNAWEWIPYEYFTTPCVLNIPIKVDHSDAKSLDFTGGGHSPLFPGVNEGDPPRIKWYRNYSPDRTSFTVEDDIGFYWKERAGPPDAFHTPGGLYAIKNQTIYTIMNYRFEKYRQASTDPAPVLIEEGTVGAFGVGLQVYPCTPLNDDDETGMLSRRRFRYFTIHSAENVAGSNSSRTANKYQKILDNTEDYAEITCSVGCIDAGDLGGTGGARYNYTAIQTKIVMEGEGQDAREIRYYYYWFPKTLMRHRFSGSLPDYVLGSQNNSTIEDLKYTVSGEGRGIEITTTHSLKVFGPIKPKQTFAINSLGVFSFSQKTSGEGIIKTRLVTEDAKCQTALPPCSSNEDPKVFKIYKDKGEEGIPTRELIEPDDRRNVSLIMTSNKTTSTGTATFIRLPCEGT